jgi:hypothetical protein
LLNPKKKYHKRNKDYCNLLLLNLKKFSNKYVLRRQEGASPEELQKLFDELNLKPPTNFNELLTTCKAIQTAKPDMVCLGQGSKEKWEDAFKKALILFNYVTGKDKTYSFEREEKIRRINELLDLWFRVKWLYVLFPLPIQASSPIAVQTDIQ